MSSTKFWMQGMTGKELKEFLRYDPETGIFIRIKGGKNCPKNLIGKPAGSINRLGYRQLKFKDRVYLAHRLAWFYVTGKWPGVEIDHINNIKTDNRWTNLREATRQENGRNRGKSARNTSGYKGVSWISRYGHWQATLKFNGRNKNLGRFKNIEDACAAYDSAVVKHHYKFAKPNKRKEFEMSAPLITISLTLPENMLTSVYALLSGGSSVPGNLPALVPAAPVADTVAVVPAADITKVTTSTTDAELDAAGVAWDPERHASTKSKTSAGLWRMKVGVSRPESEGVPAPEVSAPQIASADEDDEFAAFRTATTQATPNVRNWSDGDLSKLCNQAAMKAGGPEGVKAIIAKFVPEGQLAHSRSIPADQRENFAKEVETTFGITYEG